MKCYIEMVFNCTVLYLGMKVLCPVVTMEYFLSTVTCFALPQL